MGEPVKGVEDLPGLTAQEIWDAHFANEIDGDQASDVVQTAGFLVGREFDVWEFREPASGGTVWRDGLGKFWLVERETETIESWGG